MLRLLAAVLVPMGIAAQSFQLGSSFDPCSGGYAWTSPPLRFGDFTCTVNLPPGSYHVTLGFREPSVTAIGQRVFTVAINGTPVLQNFDLVKEGATTASYLIGRSFAAVSDGTIRIQLTAVVRSAVLSSVAITPTGAAPAAYTECGSIVTSRYSRRLLCAEGQVYYTYIKAFMDGELRFQ